MAPAPSTRMSSLERDEPGIWSSAAARTRTWSVVVLAPALPGRSSMARLSPVLAHQVARGWNPKVPLNVGAAFSFFEAAVMIVASRSRTIHPFKRRPAVWIQGKPPGRRWSSVHTWRRTRLRTLVICTVVAWSRQASRRRIVESETGAPNTCCWWS